MQSRVRSPDAGQETIQNSARVTSQAVEPNPHCERSLVKFLKRRALAAAGSVARGPWPVAGCPPRRRKRILAAAQPAERTARPQPAPAPRCRGPPTHPEVSVQGCAEPTGSAPPPSLEPWPCQRRAGLRARAAAAAAAPQTARPRRSLGLTPGGRGSRRAPPLAITCFTDWLQASALQNAPGSSRRAVSR